MQSLLEQGVDMPRPHLAVWWLVLCTHANPTCMSSVFGTDQFDFWQGAVTVRQNLT